MKKSMCVLSGVLCLFLVSCQTSVQDNSDWEDNANHEIQIEQTVQDEAADELPSDDEVELWDADAPEYVKAYTEFLLFESKLSNIFNAIKQIIN